MQIENTFIKDCFIIKPDIFQDERGFFMETFHKKMFHEKTGLKINFVQDNQSVSSRGVLRGLHFQTGAYAQAKLVRVSKGEVQDVVVDLRPESETFGKYFSIILNDENNFQLFIPKGLAHGFVTLSDEAVFSYKCDNYYDKSSEEGIVYDDKDLKIKWELKESEIMLSNKDSTLKTLEQYLM